MDGKKIVEWEYDFSVDMVVLGLYVEIREKNGT